MSANDVISWHHGLERVRAEDLFSWSPRLHIVTELVYLTLWNEIRTCELPGFVFKALTKSPSFEGLVAIQGTDDGDFYVSLVLKLEEK